MHQILQKIKNLYLLVTEPIVFFLIYYTLVVTKFELIIQGYVWQVLSATN